MDCTTKKMAAVERWPSWRFDGIVNIAESMHD